MKKQITLIVFLFFNCTFAMSQQFVKTTTPCNAELLKKTPGRWIKGGNGFYAKVSQQQQKEIQNRLDAIHPLVFNLYPSPVAFDAASFGFSTDKEFGSQLKFDHSPNVMDGRIEVNGTPTVYYSYSAKFCAYHCGREPNEIMRGQGCEAGTFISVQINSLGEFFTRTNLGDLAEVMRIEGRPIKVMPVLQGNWKGYDVYYPEQGSSQKMVLLHREGMLPFIPVTRKQYLERCLEYLPKFFTPDPNGLKAIEAWGGDKKEYDEQLKKMQKIKDDALKHYKDELQATTSAGLLSSPAIISSYTLDIGTNYPIFTTQAAGGKMLVTENPAYMKKGLPKYIPQFMVFTLWPCRCGADVSLDPYNLINENFPIEKLQAMIDK
jgi:hypothetical protein